MELNAERKDDNTIVVEAVGETVTVTNAIHGELWEDSNVKEAAQVKEHPYLAHPKVFVKTLRGKPDTALNKASDNVFKQTEEFTEKFKKALK